MVTEQYFLELLYHYSYSFLLSWEPDSLMPGETNQD